jgi:hypothetical protein
MGSVPGLFVAMLMFFQGPAPVNIVVYGASTDKSTCLRILEAAQARDKTLIDEVLAKDKAAWTRGSCIYAPGTDVPAATKI